MPPKKRPGLGKGLDALIPQTDTASPAAPTASSTGVTEVPVTAIHPNPRQPRANFHPAELAESTSIIGFSAKTVTSSPSKSFL